jgi:hypothetical protein
MTVPNRATPDAAQDARRAEADGKSAESANAPAETPGAPSEALASAAEAASAPAGALASAAEAASAPAGALAISAEASAAPAGAPAAADVAPAEAPASAEAGPAEADDMSAPPQATAAGPMPPPRATRAVAVLRRHWLFSALLAAGMVLRVLVQVGYQPALIYIDTLKYLYGASPGSEPLGYTAILRVVLTVGDLGTVAGIQHLLGPAMAVTLYAVTLRRGAPRWLAALATAPVLLDVYQLQMEHMIMPDVWFEALVVAGLAVLLWRPRVSVPAAVTGGLILAAAATVMQLGMVLVLPAVIFLLAAGGGWRQALSRSAALALAFVLVILGYSGISYARNGYFGLAHRQSLTGRLAYSADCATLTLPAAARPLCPTPAEQANGPDWLEHSGQSPLYAVQVKRGTRAALIGDINSAVMSQQPLRVLGSIAGDAARLFALTRDPVRSVTPVSRWQFQTGYPTYPPWTSICPAGPRTAQTCLVQQTTIQKQVAPASDLLVRPGGTIVVGVQKKAFGHFHGNKLRLSYGRTAQVNRPIASFLRAYQLHGGYTPGPLLALFGLAGLAGSLLLLIRRLDDRTRQLALGCLLFTATAVAILLSPDVYEFSWRYELPAVVTLVPAGLLGIWAVGTMRKAREKPGKTPAQS